MLFYQSCRGGHPAQLTTSEGDTQMFPGSRETRFPKGLNIGQDGTVGSAVTSTRNLPQGQRGQTLWWRVNSFIFRLELKKVSVFKLLCTAFQTHISSGLGRFLGTEGTPVQQVSECGRVDEQHRVVFTGQPQALVFTYEFGVMLLWNEKNTSHLFKHKHRFFC